MKGLFIVGSLIMLLCGVSCSSSALTTTNLSADLLIYLDGNYTIQWNLTNQPDLSAIQWHPDLDGWQAGTLIVYLWNTGKTTINVDAEDNLEDPAPGLDASSETVTIEPGGRSPLDIIIEESPNATSVNASDIWFNVRPAS